MMSSRQQFLCSLALCAAMQTGTFLSAEEKTDSTSTKEAKPAAAAATEKAANSSAADAARQKEVASLLSALDDPAFDMVVDNTILEEAMQAISPELLTDYGLQLAEGERIQMRSHKSGVAAIDVLKMAASWAAEKGDKVTLERLKKVAANRNLPELAAVVQAAGKFSGASRAAAEPLAIAIDSTTPEDYAIIRTLLQEIETARVIRDTSTLDALESEFGQMNNLPPAQLQKLKQVMAEARSTIGDLPQGQQNTVTALNRLAAVSRGGRPVNRGGGGMARPGNTYRPPVANRPVTTRPVNNRPVTNRPVTNRPVTNRPVTNRPVTNRPSNNRPVNNRPVVVNQPNRPNPPNRPNRPNRPGVNTGVAIAGGLAAGLLIGEAIHSHNQANSNPVYVNSPPVYVNSGYVDSGYQEVIEQDQQIYVDPNSQDIVFEEQVDDSQVDLSQFEGELRSSEGGARYFDPLLRKWIVR